MHELSGSKSHKRVAVTFGLIAIAAFLAACMSSPVAPDAAMADAKDAITSAEQSDARQYAAAELDQARQKLLLAEDAVRAERMVDARQLAQQSRITAELALAKAASAKAIEINRQMGRGADALDEEMKRMGEQQ